MKILFIHQGFPGQYLHIINELLRNTSNEVFAIGLVEKEPTWPESLKYYQYNIQRGNGKEVHPWAVDFETKVIQGEACARKLLELKEQGSLLILYVCILAGVRVYISKKFGLLCQS